MDMKAPKGSHQGKKSKNRTEEKFARKFPYRFSWLTETNAEPLQPWELTKISSSLREQLPLQKTLVPTRSIPVRGLGTPDLPPLSRLRPPPSPPSNVWELVLLSRRFPGSAPPAHTGRCRPPPRGPLLEPGSAPPLSRPPAPRALRAAAPGAPFRLR
ncbi:PREDICTED: uncharacterized protein C3orf22 homolog [Lipotes vexillifer]|uniref:Uncharacterized protein C3orf22 homolog n=1 Tax=Lipotes vexillifer TaxID=118797 RepID=A0A340Y166_LIPVE|nr:PREDICTED: uncharacterized protein C3orf22 homolog [Lipotes vexillifer]